MSFADSETKFVLRRPLHLHMLLSNLSLYCAWRIVSNGFQNKFEISVPTLSQKFEQLDGLYSILFIKDYFQFVVKCILLY